MSDLNWSYPGMSVLSNTKQKKLHEFIAIYKFDAIYGLKLSHITNLVTGQVLKAMWLYGWYIWYMTLAFGIACDFAPNIDTEFLVTNLKLLCHPHGYFDEHVT